MSIYDTLEGTRQFYLIARLPLRAMVQREIKVSPRVVARPPTVVEGICSRICAGFWAFVGGLSREAGVVPYISLIPPDGIAAPEAISELWVSSRILLGEGISKSWASSTGHGTRRAVRRY